MPSASYTQFCLDLIAFSIQVWLIMCHLPGYFMCFLLSNQMYLLLNIMINLYNNSVIRYAISGIKLWLIPCLFSEIVTAENFVYNKTMTSSDGSIFGVTGPFWGESTSHRWMPLTKVSDAELWCFLWSAPKQATEQTIEPSHSLWRHCNAKWVL